MPGQEGSRESSRTPRASRPREGMAPLPTGRLSEQVAHRRGSMGGLLLQVPSRLDLSADAYSGPMELVLLLVVIGGLVAVAVTAGEADGRSPGARPVAAVTRSPGRP